jgi:hypothetical protein
VIWRASSAARVRCDHAMPVLLRSREVPLQVVLAAIVPALVGAIAGWLLGVNELAYVVWSVLALAGGFFAGLEHDGAGEGAVRGVLGGGLFGAMLLLVHQATGQKAKANLPEPEVVLVAITALIGTVSGALGGARRAKREGAMAEAQQEEQSDDADEGQTKQQQAARETARQAKKEREEGKEPAFSLKRLHWYEFVGFAGALILAGSLFLPWFSTSCASDAAAHAAARAGGEGCNPNSVYNGMRGDFSGFATFKYLDWILVAACIAPFILAYIIARGHKLSWKPGEVTMIIGMIATALILLNGIILGKPGDTVDMKFEIGWFVGLFGAILLMVGGTLRQALHADAKKPPGVM